MARDPLAVLARLRETAVEEATRDLARALAEEREAAARLADHADQIRVERDGAGPDAVADFAAWLPRARAVADSLTATLRETQARVARARDILTARKTAAEAIAKLRERQRDAAALLRGRREQAALDEDAGRRHQARASR